MSDYRRWYVPGGTAFFTVVAYRRRRLFDDSRACELLGRVMRSVRDELPFTTVASVLLPDHLHMIWALPAGDGDFSTRWKKIKRDFTVGWLAVGGKELPVSVSQADRGNRGVWQRRFYEHQVRDEGELSCLSDYIHYNPVKHGYADRPWNWRHTTFRRFVEAGHYEQDWGRTQPDSIQGLDYE